MRNTASDVSVMATLKPNFWRLIEINESAPQPVSCDISVLRFGGIGFQTPSAHWLETVKTPAMEKDQLDRSCEK
jgi:hypothetical protein